MHSARTHAAAADTGDARVCLQHLLAEAEAVPAQRLERRAAASERHAPGEEVSASVLAAARVMIPDALQRASGRASDLHHRQAPAVGGLPSRRASAHV